MPQTYLIERIAFGGKDPLASLDAYVAIYQGYGREMFAIIGGPTTDQAHPLVYVFSWYCPDGDADQ